MTRQEQLLNEVINALRYPETSPYYGLPFQEAANMLASKLEEVAQMQYNESVETT